MGRRKELKDIASGLYGSFISRNNDVGGYWGIGKLCLLSQRKHTTAVQLDLINSCISPESAEFQKLLTGYKEKLEHYLVTRQIPIDWVASARIVVNFSPVQPSNHVPITTWGKLFHLSVSITDDRDKLREVSGYGYCGPHNPIKESKSAGKERF